MMRLLILEICISISGIIGEVYRPEFEELKRRVDAMKTGLCGRNKSESTPKTHILRFGGMMDGEDSDTVDAYFPDEPLTTNFFQLSTRMPKSRSRFGLEKVKNQVYLFGGSQATNELSDVDVYNLKVSTKFNKYFPRESMMSPKSGMATALMPGDKVLICGGLFGLTSESTCDIYDPASNEWAARNQIQPLPAAKAGATGVTLDKFVYILGGGDTQNPRTPSNQVLRYHIHYNTWQQVNNLLVPRIYAAACAMGGQIYVCGGLGDDLTPIRSCEKYDPKEDSWSAITEMTRNGAKMNSGLALLDYNGSLLAVHEDSVELYEPYKNEWKVLPGGLDDRKNFGAIAI